MNIQQHARITKIKKLSRYLYLCLTGIHYLLWILCPLAVVLMLISKEVTFKLNDAVLIPASDLTLVQHLILVICIAPIFYFLLKLSYHFRELIRYFSDGDIFNKKAIDHARKSLLNGFAIYGMYLIIGFAGWIYLLTQQQNHNITMNGNFILGLIFFGLMYLLLWALEIGADLNEESELTI
jgi:hypothetical protein